MRGTLRRVCEPCAEGRPDRAFCPFKLSGDESRYTNSIYFERHFSGSASRAHAEAVPEPTRSFRAALQEARGNGSMHVGAR